MHSFLVIFTKIQSTINGSWLVELIKNFDVSLRLTILSYFNNVFVNESTMSQGHHTYSFRQSIHKIKSKYL